VGGEAARADGAEGRELVATADAAGKTVFVDETFLYDPLVREMKKVIDAGELGEVFHLSFERLGMGRIRRDSNVWWNSAPHDLSILFYLVPRPVKAVGLHLHTHLQPGVADMAVCDLELEGGVTAHVYLSWLHPEKTATVTVVGRDRMLAYEGRFEKRAITLFDYAIDLTSAVRHGRGRRADRAHHEVRGPKARRGARDRAARGRRRALRRLHPPGSRAAHERRAVAARRRDARDRRRDGRP
jgi:predicted dehydrogenase